MPKKILVVDDEAAIRTYMETLLGDHGYDTVTAADGNEALETARKEKPDLITLDITMPEKSGVGFYKTIRSDEALKDIPIFIVTAVTGYGGQPESFKKFISSRRNVAPPEGFYPKPIDREEFLEGLKKTLG